MAKGLRDRNARMSRIVAQTSSDKGYRSRKDGYTCTLHGNVPHINTPWCNWQARKEEQ